MNNNWNKELVLLDFEKSLEPLIAKLKNAQKIDRESIQKDIDVKLKKIYKDISNWEKTLVARHPNRPHSKDYINYIFKKVMYLDGDRQGFNDECIVCALAELDGMSVVIVGQQKGSSTEENVKYNFGMPKPEGYRKALRLFELANRFQKPIITFIDTPGAFPGIEAEERLQGEAIARNLREMGQLKVPVISVVIGEGGSGGALGIGVANHVLMLEHSVYSVISPESCASILWRDPNKKEIAAKMLKNDAETSMGFGIVDEIIDEPVGGAHRDWKKTFLSVKKYLIKNLKYYQTLKPDAIMDHRIKKFIQIGNK